MVDSPKISVIMPVFNGALVVEKAILSIQSQTFMDWELNVFNDGSTDNSLDIVSTYAKRDKRIHIYQEKTNKGLAYAMNRLVSISKGKYLAVQEQDDVSLPTRLQAEYELLEEKPLIGLVSGIAEWIGDDGKVQALFPGILARGEQFPQDKIQMVKYLYVEQSKIVNAACMFRKSILENFSLPFDEDAKVSIDWQFFLHIAHKYLIWGIPEILVRMNRGNSHKHLTGDKDLQFNEARRCIRKIYNEYKRDPLSPINFQLYRRALSFQLNLEGRHYGSIKGLGRIIMSLVYHPSNRKAWHSLRDMSNHLFKSAVVSLK